MKSTVAIIPARGGSKGIHNKNTRFLAGKPLIAHSILAAQQAKNLESIYVSTDSSDIASIARDYGAEVIQRPPSLATDAASSESALLHALATLESSGVIPDLVVFLQCTSPFRTSDDIDRAIQKLQQEDADSLLSASPSHRFLWHRINGVVTPINYDYRQRQRRQDMNPQYVENGSIYIFKPWVLKEFGNRLGGKISLYEMAEDQSWEIDSLADFEYIEFLLQRKSASLPS